MAATFLWLMIGIKLPLVLLGVIIWRAARDVPESSDDSDGGGNKRVQHPRKPLPRPPRRGPHGDPRTPPPRRVRTVIVPAREPREHR